VAIVETDLLIVNPTLRQIARSLTPLNAAFAIICTRCGSTRVVVENSLRYNPECGPWGDVRLRCLDCLRDEIIAEC
jgi:hypothetical protein